MKVLVAASFTQPRKPSERKALWKSCARRALPAAWVQRYGCSGLTGSTYLPHPTTHNALDRHAAAQS